MKKNKIFRFAIMALALAALFTFTACQRSQNGDRMDITIDLSDNRLATSESPPPLTGIDGDPDIEYVHTALVPIPERHLPFEPGEIDYVNDNPNIRMIEINQCLSYGFDTDTGEFYPMENFVAGKETAVFVSFIQPFDPTAEAVLTVVRDGRMVAQLLPVASPDAYTLQFQPRDMAEVGNWEAGAYSFVVDTDGGQAVRTVNFYDSTYLKILAVPVRANYSGRVVSCEGDWRNGAAMIIAAYPIARDNVEYILAPELDLSDNRYDLNTDEGMFYVWNALTNLQTKTENYTLIIGYIRDAAGFGQILGYTYGMPTTIVVESEPDMLATVPHEVAHCYKIGDEYQGGHLNLDANVPPYRMSGRDIMTNNPVTAQNPNVVGGPSLGVRGTGSVIYEEQRPYWVEGSSLLGAVTSYMGGGTGAEPFTLWTTSEIWNWIYRIYVGHAAGDDFDDHEAEYWGQCPSCYGNVFDPDFYVECWECRDFFKINGFEFRCPSCSSFWHLDDYADDLYLECSECKYFLWYNWFEEHNSDTAITANITQGRFIRVSGYIDGGDTFVPSPWYIVDSNQNLVTPGGLGEYGVYVYDNAGNLLSVTYFNVEAYAKVTTTDGPMLMELSRIPVNVSVRYVTDASRIDIRHGDDVLFSRNLTPNAPTVEFTGLTDLQQLSDSVTLTWDAYDADGDELYFEIWYYSRGEECFNVASNITGRSAVIDLSDLPGTHAGHFLIYATDGVWTAEAESPRVRVPYKAPIIVNESNGIVEIKLTEQIRFDAEVYDMQDGWIWDNDYVSWSHDGEHYLNGTLLWVWPFEFAPGLHTFTCTARNSMGMTTEKEFTFLILDDDSDLPDDWSRDDIRLALSYGFVLPLDRLDAPITRGQFADLMLVLYLYVLEEDFDVSDFEAFAEENVLEDCPEDDIGPYLMTYIGVMDAPGGFFDPTRSISERDAALIMFRVAALSDPAMLNVNDYTDEEMIEFFRGYGILDDEGPNAFQDAERLTARLGLVRTSRFFAVIFVLN